MYSEWSLTDFSQLNVDDIEAGTELIEFDLSEARYEVVVETVNYEILESFSFC